MYICTPPTVPLHLAPSCSHRQAVALAFDHAVLPASAPLAPGSETRIGSGSSHAQQQQQQQHRGTPPRGGGYGGSGDSSNGGGGARFGDVLGREAVALSLLMDLVAMCSGTGSGGGGGGGSGAATQQQLGPSSPSVSATSSSPLTRGTSVRMSSGGGGVGGGGSFLGASAPVLHYPGGGSVVGSVGGSSGVNGGGLWMRCPTPPPRTFLLELLEGVLSQRYDVFRRLPQMTVALRQRVGGDSVWG